ncbi:MAG TPA: dephospho-CoA kinase [Candidatus Acidoferrales bacterium]|nr:dephospho-CoA kinase [Candidatus Acidoferrales bacterium]
MLRVGLTGGIGSGKSTVVRMLREWKLPVIEADDAAREVTRAGQPAYQEILAAFGPRILQPAGEIDRALLAAVVFASAEDLEKLNRIVHPRVIERTSRWLEEQQRAGEAVAIVEAPLLIEGGYHREFDRLAVVWCRPEQQLERLAARGMSRTDAERRIAAQMPIEEKRGMANDVIDNSGALDRTRGEVARWVEKLRLLAGESQGGDEAGQ